MPRIAITQRVELSQNGERRDCLDQRWAELARALKIAILPLPNACFAPGDEKGLSAWLSEYGVSGIILSGGNTPVCRRLKRPDDAAPERDALESLLLTLAPPLDLPVLGICRGMQFINCFYGGGLEPLAGHVALRHPVENIMAGEYCFNAIVNSYHGYGIPAPLLAPELEALACAPDGSVEALRHKEHAVHGIMWHPEREQPFSDTDRALIGRLLRLN